jgi:hypothetical protein
VPTPEIAIEFAATDQDTQYLAAVKELDIRS